MPTALPPPIRRVEKKRSLFTTVLNTFMVVSALLLTVMVLVREQGYANGQPGYFAGALAQLTQTNSANARDDSAIIPPSN